jgi:hypothetical protein
MRETPHPAHGPCYGEGMLSLLFMVLIVLLCAGFAYWLIGVLPFIAAPFKQILQGVILFIALLWLLYTLWAAFFGGGVAAPHPLRM